MPRRAHRICGRCGGTYAGRRCPTCAERRMVRQDATRGAEYSGAAWLALRARYLRAHPYCECLKCSALFEFERDRATEVDHIDGLGPSGPRGLDWWNLQALSKRHHSEKTARHDGGFGNRRKPVVPKDPEF